MNSAKINIIGAGYSSLSAACYLAQAGHEVTIFEKNDQVGGRSRQFTQDGFVFDMGPTWYWMPDVFEKFFADFGKRPSDYYKIIRTDPSYRVYFGAAEYSDMPTSIDGMIKLFEQEETGAGKRLEKFLKEAEDNYRIAIHDLVYRPGESPLELVTKKTMTKVGLFIKTISQDIRGRFKSEKLRSILEFPVLFLGAKPEKTPAFYNFMNYADMVLGTWHPEGGMFSVVKGMTVLAEELGVKFVLEADVEEVVVTDKRATGLIVKGVYHESDVVLSGADYAHTESLLSKEHRAYDQSYWNSRVFAPSALLFYVGFDKPIENVLHHTLFFDVPFGPHASEIYDNPSWPTAPLFYASFPSKTDTPLAPDGKENGIFLIPVAAGIEDNEETRERYFTMIMDRMTALIGNDPREAILFKRSYCINDFKDDYNSYKGNAYGLANTLRQTAFLRPSIKSKKVEGLYFSGQLTVPGPGVPPSLISGRIASESVLKNLKKNQYASTI